MPSTITLPVHKVVGTQRVYVKNYWADEWTLVPGLWASDLSWGTLPQVGEAALHWNAFVGSLGHESQTTYHPRIDLDRKFVMVDYLSQALGESVTKIVRWIGKVDMERQHRADTLLVGGQRKMTGEQAIMAAGAEQLFADTILLKGWFPTGEEVIDRTEIHWAPTFNEGGKPNRSKTKVDGAYLFAKTSVDAAFWSTRDIVEYLLRSWHLPKRGDGGDLIPAVTIYGEQYLFDWDQPVIEAHGRSVWDVLCELIHERRGLGARFSPGSTPAEPWRLYVFTYVSEDVQLSSEHHNRKLLKNDAYRVAATWGTGAVSDGRPDLISVVHRQMDSQYDQVVAQGARRRTCFSTFITNQITAAESAFAEDWTSGDRTDFNAAASGAGDYAGLTASERKERNDDARDADKLSHVFARFRLEDSWDGKGGNLFGDSRQPALKDERGTENVSNWPLGFRLCRTLPLFEGQDYTGSLNGRPYSSDKEEPNVLPVMVFIPLGDLGSEDLSEDGKWALAEKYGMVGTSKRNWSLRVQVEEWPPKLWLKVHNASQQIIAGAGAAPGFDPLPDANEIEPTKSYPLFYATICLEESRFAEFKHPENPDTSVAHFRVKYLDCGNAYRLDWLTGKTAVGIDPATSKLQFSREIGGFVRDDRPQLEQIAKMAWEFFKKPRVHATFQKPGATEDLWLGMYLSQIGREDDPADTVQILNTVVTGVSLHFPDDLALPIQSWTTSHPQLRGLEFVK